MCDDQKPADVKDAEPDLVELKELQRIARPDSTSKYSPPVRPEDGGLLQLLLLLLLLLMRCNAECEQLRTSSSVAFMAVDVIYTTVVRKISHGVRLDLKSLQRIAGTLLMLPSAYFGSSSRARMRIETCGGL